MIVSFLGTKGGTGTTTMAVNVGAEARRVTDRATVVMDLKPAPGDVALFLGVRPRFTLTHLLDRLAWRDPGLMAAYLTAHACGVDVLAAGDEWGRPSVRDAEGIEATLQCLRSTYEFVLVDAGSALTPTTAVALQASDLVVLVANPDVPCLRNLQRLIDAVRLSGVSTDQLRVLLNRASEFGAVSVKQIESVLRMTIDWTVPSDYRTVAAAVTSGVPVRALRVTGLQDHIEAVARAIAGDGYEPPAFSTSTATVAPREDSGASQ
ncbi:MAG: CpaE family protein [Vicinamibacterales bacterium]